MREIRCPFCVFFVCLVSWSCQAPLFVCVCTLQRLPELRAAGEGQRRSAPTGQCPCRLPLLGLASYPPVPASACGGGGGTPAPEGMQPLAWPSAVGTASRRASSRFRFAQAAPAPVLLRPGLIDHASAGRVQKIATPSVACQVDLSGPTSGSGANIGGGGGSGGGGRGHGECLYRHLW